MKICPRCRFQNRDAAYVCENCGNTLLQHQQYQQPNYQQPGKRKKGKGCLVTGIIVLVVIAVIIFFVILFGAIKDIATETEPSTTLSSTTVEENTEFNGGSENTDAKTREEAIEADFIKINGDEWYGKLVYASGEVSNYVISEDYVEFTLSVKTDSGIGTYNIETYTFLDETAKEIQNGDTVKIYGMVSYKNDLGMPTIMATIVEI